MSLPFINNGDSGLVSRNKINAGLAQPTAVFYAEDQGVDCTGATDASAGLQAAINSLPDNAVLEFPIDSIVTLGTTINITDRVGIQLMSLVRQQNAPGAPIFKWTANGGAMFAINHSDHPSFTGLSFVNDGITGTADYFLKFDGNPVVHIGTLGLVDNCTFNASGATNTKLKMISISETAVNNHENYIVRNCSFFGTQGLSVRCHDAVTNAGSPNVSSATAAFVPGDTGVRIRVTYAGRYVDTTIKTVVNAQNIILNANVPDTKASVTIHTGQNYGIGIENGASQNAIQQQFLNNQFTFLEYGIRMAGGNAQIEHVSGSQNDFGIWIGGFVAEQCSINWYESESDARGIESLGPLLEVRNSRLSNGNQFGDGFYKFPQGKVNLFSCLQEFNCTTNQVIIGAQDGGGSSATLVSINNRWLQSYSQVGYDRFVPQPIFFQESFNGGAPGLSGFDSFGPSAPTLIVNRQTDGSGGASFATTVENFFASSTAPLIGNQSSAPNANGIGSYSAFKAIAAAGSFHLEQKMFEATWPSVDATGYIGGPTACYGYYGGPVTIAAGTLPDMYGSYLAKQGGAGITRSWGYYQADAGDTNFYGGPTQFGNTIQLKNYTVSTLPTPTTGMMAYVTDADAGLAWGATAINSGGGATKYLVWYNGANWTVAGK